MNQQEKSYESVSKTIFLRSCKHKLNTKSSTETELVVVENVMGQALWTIYLLASQGNTYPQQPYTKTAKAPYDGQKMDVHHTLKEQDI